MQVCEKELGLDSFAEQIENNKFQFVNLIEGIVGNMSKEYDNMVKEKEKYSKIMEKVDPSTYIVRVNIGEDIIIFIDVLRCRLMNY